MEVGMERDKRLNRRKLIFQIMNKLWLVAVAAVAGAVLAAGIYYAKGIVKQPERYEAKFTIYLTFEEEGAEVNIQYYNSYTWKELVKDDPIMDYVMAHLPEDYSRDEVNRAVEMSTPSDVRVLLGTVTTSDPVRSETIAQAMAGGILHFRDKVDVFTDMELWRMDPARRVLIDAETVRVGGRCPLNASGQPPPRTNATGQPIRCANTGRKADRVGGPRRTTSHPPT